MQLRDSRERVDERLDEELLPVECHCPVVADGGEFEPEVVRGLWADAKGARSVEVGERRRVEANHAAILPRPVVVAAAMMAENALDQRRSRRRWVLDDRGKTCVPTRHALSGAWRKQAT